MRTRDSSSGTKSTGPAASPGLPRLQSNRIPAPAKGFEVDFLARYSDGTGELIQVCTSIADPETRSREIRALLDAAAGHPRARQKILTPESRLPFPAVPEPVGVLPAWAWMLQGS